MAEPYFRKGDVLVWDKRYLDDTRNTKYIELFGMGPFVCFYDIPEKDTLYNPIDPTQIEDVVPIKELHACFAWRFQRDEFLTNVLTALALPTTDNRSDKEKEIET